MTARKTPSWLPGRRCSCSVALASMSYCRIEPCNGSHNLVSGRLRFWCKKGNNLQAMRPEKLGGLRKVNSVTSSYSASIPESALQD
jgi:hypothetical protein